MIKKEKIGELQCVLTVLYVAAFLISNVITSKQILLPFNITSTGGLFIFPVTYILSDVFSEVYGYAWSRKTCYMAFAMNLLMVLYFQLAIITPAPGYWTAQEAFQVVLGNAPRVLIGSLTAFVLGDMTNDIVFKRMKLHRNGLEGFGWRAIASSAAGELVDSLIFYPIAFLGLMPVKTLLIMVITQVPIKVGYEVIILPLTKRIVKWVEKVECTN